MFCATILLTNMFSEYIIHFPLYLFEYVQYLFSSSCSLHMVLIIFRDVSLTDVVVRYHWYHTIVSRNVLILLSFSSYSTLFIYWYGTTNKYYVVTSFISSYRFSQRWWLSKNRYFYLLSLLMTFYISLTLSSLRKIEFQLMTSYISLIFSWCKPVFVQVYPYVPQQLCFVMSDDGYQNKMITMNDAD